MSSCRATNANMSSEAADKMAMQQMWLPVFASLDIEVADGWPMRPSSGMRLRRRTHDSAPAYLDGEC